MWARLVGSGEVVGIGADPEDARLPSRLELGAVQGIFLRGRTAGQEGDEDQGDEAGAHGAPIR